MIIEVFFISVTLIAVFAATFVKHLRHAVLALWVAGLGVGAFYLTLGAEFLAIIQWMVSTLVTISFVFFSVMFGEYNPAVPGKSENHPLLKLLSTGLGVGFAVIIWKAAKELPVPHEAGSVDGSALKTVGKALTQENLLSLEVLALVLFLALVGGGVVARSEGSDGT